MNQHARSAIHELLDRLGPRRVQNGLDAFTSRNGEEGSFLAAALRGELDLTVDRRDYGTVARWLGLSRLTPVEVVATAFESGTVECRLGPLMIETIVTRWDLLLEIERWLGRRKLEGTLSQAQGPSVPPYPNAAVASR